MKISCWENRYDGWPANLCISAMRNPIQLDFHQSKTVEIISRPSEPWEQYPHGNGTYLATCEGNDFLKLSLLFAKLFY